MTQDLGNSILRRPRSSAFAIATRGNLPPANNPQCNNSPHDAAAIGIESSPAFRAIAASWLFSLQTKGVSIVGLIPQGFPSLTMPDASLIAQLAPGAVGIALMSFTETIAAGRAFAAPSDPPLRSNRELLATGVASLGGALTGAMPGGGGTSQTAVVRNAGFDRQLGPERLLFNARAAIERYQALQASAGGALPPAKA